MGTMNAPARLTNLPADFPNFGSDRNVAIVDNLIAMLRQERASLSDPTCRATALARIERARAALVEFGDAPYSRASQYEMLVDTLDRSAELDAPIESRIGFVQLILGEAMPNARIRPGVIRDAVTLWPAKKQREAREKAIRELARALGCNPPSLNVMLREARKRIGERRKARTT